MQQITTLPVSGYRGIWGQNLNPEIVRDLTRAFGVFTQKRDGKKILIGRDARHSGEEILGIISSTLTEMGFDVVDAGIVPTPTILFLTKKKGYDGALIATASHNPPEYNGIKFVTGRGLFTTEDEAEEIVSYYSTWTSGFQLETGGPSRTVLHEPELWREHAKHIVSCVDVEKIKNKKLKVVVDTINSTGAVVDPYFFELLGVEAIIINEIPDGNFAHMPEPLPENLKTLGEKVREVGADVGFAQDPDADRLVVCDETGKVISEEYTLALGILSVLSKEKGDIVINLSTSRVNELIGNKFGVKTYRSKVGEGNVVEMMQEVNALVGGEGGGGFIYPKMNEARDSLAGMATIITLLVETGQKLSEIVETLPKTYMAKTKIPAKIPFPELKPLILKGMGECEIDERDGLRLDFSDGRWVSARASNTEPIIRIMAECATEKEANELLEEVVNLVKNHS
jgi:phosphomannomutase